MKRFFVWAMLAFLTLTVPTQAQDKLVEIQHITTPAGITLWLVEDHTLPMVSTQVVFRAGSAFVPAGKEGLAAFTASLLSEGAGDMNAEAYKAALERVGARFYGAADETTLSANLVTLEKYKTEAFALLGKALQQPRFDADAVKRVQAQQLAAIKRTLETPAGVLARAFDAAVYGDHPYAHPVSGYLATVAAFQTRDARGFHKTFFTRSNMVVSMVGALTPAEAAALVDSALAPLPQGDKAYRVETLPPEVTPSIQRISMDTPQSFIQMGHVGINRHDPDYFAALLVNYILGGGGFASRLMEEVREKRGLAYSVYSRFVPMPGRGIFMAGVQTKNETADKAIALIRKEIEKLTVEPVSTETFAKAQQFMVDSFPLRLDSNNKILNHLSMMQLEEVGIDYLDNWTANIKVVTHADIQRVAKRLLHTDKLVTVIVGQ